jgi:hypothetical protein
MATRSTEASFRCRHALKQVAVGGTSADVGAFVWVAKGKNVLACFKYRKQVQNKTPVPYLNLL